MNKNKMHLAFDMDGVIYSAENFIAEAYENAIKNSGLGFEPPTTDEILTVIGKPVGAIFTELFGELNNKQIGKLLVETRTEICKMIKEDKGHIFDGMPEIISKLAKDYTLSICSNAGNQYVVTILEHYKLKPYFTPDPALTLENTGAEDKKKLLEHYIMTSDADASGWIMIGDRKSDLEAAQYNNCPFIGCFWGHGEIEELDGADVIIENPESLIKAVKKVTGGR
jgi:phosphoglycolate phosphatase